MTQTPTAAITLDITQGVAWITLNRPPLNILTLEMIRELDGVLSAVAEQTWLKAAVLAANGKAFCAGVDVADHTPARVEPMIREFGQLFTRLRILPMPTIAVVQGAALGGGCELAVACDQVLAAASAKFGQPEIRLGVFPPIAAALLPQLIGYQKTARLLFSGETINAAEAARLGLVTYLAADDDLQATLDRLLTQFRGMSAAALRMTKRAILYGSDLGVTALPEIEDLYLRDLMDTADAQEGIQAFMEKRQPTWSDK
ncbi:MAG TPA: enoyl-CoA hydratase-related protein [Ktedonobacteraceae bacterium]